MYRQRRNLMLDPRGAEVEVVDEDKVIVGEVVENQAT